MFESRILSSAELQLSYWRDGYINQSALASAFDHALANDNPTELQAIAQLINDTSGTHNFEALQSRMRAIAEPAFEHVRALTNGDPITDELGDRIDAMHAHTIEMLDREVQFRDGLKTVNYTRFNELTGIISELAVMGLLNRNGRYSNFALIPSSLEEDHGIITPTLRRTGIDFTAYPVQSPETPLKLQVKTARGNGLPYEDDIVVARIIDLVSENGMTRPEITKAASVHLPMALIHMEHGVASAKEAKMVGTAAVRLTALLSQPAHTT
jgi:hypothetical protein